MLRRYSKVLVAGLLVLMAAGAMATSHKSDGVDTDGDSQFTLTFGPAAASPAAAAVGSTFELAQNPAFDNSQFKNQTAITFSRTRLAPCVVRVMHLHRNVDELYVSMSGRVAVATAFPDGTIVRDVLKPGQSFVIVRNWIHTIYNPDCKKDAEFLSFVNGVEAFNTNVAKAAFDINAGPFKAYTDAKFLDSANSAIGTFAYDPQCLARCRITAKNGQLAAGSGSGPSYRKAMM